MLTKPHNPDDCTFESVLDRLRQNVSTAPDDLAFAFVADRGPTAELSWSDLERASDAFAMQLLDRGLSGRRIVLMYPSSLAFIVAFLGSLKSRAIAVPLPHAQRPADLARVAAVRRSVDIAAACAPPDSGWADRLDGLTVIEVDPLACRSVALAADALPPAEPDDLAFLQFTSGSTGRPRGVRVTHGNIAANTAISQAAFGTSRASRGVGWLPMFHDMGLIGNVLHPVSVGFPATLMAPSAMLRRPRFWLETISRTRATISGGPSSAFRHCIDRAGIGPDLDLSCWDVAFCGAERVDPATVRQFADHFAAAGFRPESFFPCYGLAEATLFVSGGPRQVEPRFVELDAAALATGRAQGVSAASAGAVSLVGCGAVTSDRVAIVATAEGAARRLQDGEVGEIWVSGASVADGYEGSDDDAYDTFGRSLDGAAGWMASGDLGFVMRNELFVTGRRKELIVINGANHHPEDIETVVCAAAPALNPLACVAFALDSDAGEQVGIAAELRRGMAATDEKELARHVSSAVAVAFGFGVSAFTLLRPGTLPRTTSGKLERVRVRAEFGRKRADPHAAWPADTLEALVAQLTGVPASRIDLTMSVGELGLDSLRLYRLQALAADRLGLYARIEDLLGGMPVASAFSTPPPAASSASPTALSDAQLGIWLEQQRHADSPMYTMCAAAEIDPSPDPARLRAALATLSARHPLLTMNVADASGTPVWSFGEPGRVIPLTAEDLPTRAAIRNRLTSLSATPLHLARDPLVSFFLLRAPDAQVLAVLAHHIVTDAWSLQLLAAELEQAYRDAAAMPAAVSFAALVEWQQDWLASPAGEAAIAFWQTQPAAGARLRWPDEDGTERHARGTSRHHFSLSEELIADVEGVARSHDATPFHLMLAVHALCISRWTGEARPSITVPMFGRPDAEMMRIQGFCVQPVALNFDLASHRSFESLLVWTRDAVRAAARHQWLPLARRHPPAGSSQCQIGLLEAADPAAWPLLTGSPEPVPIGEWTVTPWDVAPADQATDLTFAISPAGSTWRVLVDHRCAAISTDTIERMCAHWRALLHGAATGPSKPLAELDAPLPADVGSRLAGAPVPPAEVSWLARTFAVARQHPDRKAVICDSASITYEVLLGRAAAIAAMLRRAGVRPGDRVAMHLPRTPELVAALLGILRSGAACVPLDPAYPEARLRSIATRSRPKALLTDAAGAAWIPDVAPAVLRVDAEVRDENEGDGDFAPPEHEAAALILFTSGSTGQPKGVVVRHGGLEARLAWAASRYPRSVWTGVAATTSICFDLSLFELLVPLSLGGTVHLFEDALALADVADSGDIRLVNTVPSACRALIDRGAFPAGPDYLNLCGEPLPAELVADIQKAHPHLRVINVYGPTEDTIYATAAEMERPASGKPLVGCPLPGSEALVLDGDLRLVPRNVPGELFLGGAGLARGYFDAPGETALRFVPHPHSDRPGARLYRTGDLARMRPDGQIDVLGRTDHQVKVRGFRVELEEVAAALRGLDGVTDAAVLAHGAETGHTVLVAYVAGPPQAAAETLRQAAAELLPDYMVPNAVIVLPRLPLTPNGKIDRSALAALGWQRAEGTPPATEREAVLLELWRAALGNSALGVTDDFLSAGGNSIMSMQLLRDVNARFGTAMNLPSLMQANTVRKLAQHLERIAAVQAIAAGSEEPAAAGEMIEL